MINLPKIDPEMVFLHKGKVSDPNHQNMFQTQLIKSLTSTDCPEDCCERPWPRTVAEYQALYGQTSQPIHLDHQGDLDNRRDIED